MTIKIEKLIKIIERKKRIDPQGEKRIGLYILQVGEENCSSFRK